MKIITCQKDYVIIFSRLSRIPSMTWEQSWLCNMSYEIFQGEIF